MMRTWGMAWMLAGAMLLGGCHGGDAKSGSDAKSGGESQSSKGGAGGSDAKSGGSDTSSQSKDGSVPTDTVKIVPADQAKAGIQVAAVTVRSMPQTLTVPGQVALNDRLTEHIGALADGRIETVSVVPGDPVRRGQVLATLHSHSVHETVAALAQAFAAQSRAESEVGYATAKRDRYTKLLAIQAASVEEKQGAEQELAQANKNLTDAEANVVAEREHLAELLQVRPDSLTPTTIYNRELVPIRAVADGVVISRNATPGQVVTTGDELFVTANLAVVWVNAAINEADVARVKQGARATVEQQGQPAGALAGTITRLGDLVDPQTRTLPVRVQVVNRGTLLRPNMFVTVRLDEPGTRRSIFVPSGALQDVNGFRVVFVTGDGQTFQARAVKTGVEGEGMVEITDGLQPTDHVVANGAFMVKGELLKGTVGDG